MPMSKVKKVHLKYVPKYWNWSIFCPCLVYICRGQHKNLQPALHMYSIGPLIPHLEWKSPFWSCCNLTLFDTPVQKEQQARVSLTGGVIIQQEGSDGGESSQGLQLESLLLTDRPVTSHRLPLGQGTRWLHERQQSQNHPFLPIDLDREACLDVALPLFRSLHGPGMRASPAPLPCHLTW